MDGSRFPPEIARLVTQGQSQGLTEYERTILRAWAQANGGSREIDLVIRNAPVLGERSGASGPSLPSLPDTPFSPPELNFDWLEELGQIGEGTPAVERQPGFGGIPPTNTDGAPDRAAQDAEARRRRDMPPSVADRVNSASARLEELPIINAPEEIQTNWKTEAVDLAKRIPGADHSTAAVIPGAIKFLDPVAATPPDRGGGNDRKEEHGARVDRRIRRNAPEISGTAPDSAFAGIDENYLAAIANDPAMAARFMAEQATGGAKNAGAAGAVLQPRLEQAMNLNQTGITSGRRRLGGFEAGMDQLQAAEELVNAVGPGEYLNPQTLYRQTLRNAKNTPVTEMEVGGQFGGAAGDPANQMAVTNGALMAAAEATMTPEAIDGLVAKLNQAAQDYMVGVASGEIDFTTTSYPEYLRQKKARRWVGPGWQPGAYT